MTIKFTKTFHWLKKYSDDIYYVGLTNYIQKKLGHIIYIELPEQGEMFQINDPIGFIELKKTIIEMQSPLSGKIIQLNPLVTSFLESQNYSGNEHWLFILQASEPEEYHELLDSEFKI